MREWVGYLKNIGKKESYVITLVSFVKESLWQQWSILNVVNVESMLQVKKNELGLDKQVPCYVFKLIKFPKVGLKKLVWLFTKESVEFPFGQI